MSTTQYIRQGDCEVAVNAVSTQCRLFTCCRCCFHFFACGSNRTHRGTVLLRSAVQLSLMSHGPVAHFIYFGLSSRAGGGVSRVCAFAKDGKCNITQGGTGVLRGQDPGEQGPSIPALRILHPCLCGLFELWRGQPRRNLKGESFTSMMFFLWRRCMLQLQPGRFLFQLSLAKKDRV